MEKIKNILTIIIENITVKETGELNIIGNIIFAFVIYIIMKFIMRISQTIINRIIKSHIKTMEEKDKKKYITLAQVFRSIVKVIIYFIGIVTILDIFHINTNSIIATAGIGSLAIGFGAQSLVKDIITGSFILIEDQYSVGDHVELKGYEGIVEELGLRLTKIRDFNGELHIIPNGEISIVTNKSRGNITTLINVTIAYEENLNNVIDVLEKMCEDIKKTNNDIIEGPYILGVNKLGENGIDITIKILSKPLNQYTNKRYMNKKVKETLEKEGIEIPYTRMVILNKED